MTLAKLFVLLYSGAAWALFFVLGALSSSSWLILIAPIIVLISFPIGLLFGNMLSKKTRRTQVLVCIAMAIVAPAPFLIPYLPLKLELETLPIPPGVTHVQKNVSWSTADGRRAASIQFFLTSTDPAHTQQEEDRIQQFYRNALQGQQWSPCPKPIRNVLITPERFSKNGFLVTIPTGAIIQSQMTMGFYLVRGSCD